MSMPDIVVVGGGVAGLVCALGLSQKYRVTLVEALPRLGGHSNTQTVTVDNQEIAVDTGFIVYNTHNYPHLVGLLNYLGAPSYASNMSFSASLLGGDIEYASHNMIGHVSNLTSRDHWRMLFDIRRFFNDAEAIARTHDESISMAKFLAVQNYSSAFIERHIIPMASAIWSTPPSAMLDFPACHFMSFFANHRLLQVRNRPIWRTITGGSQTYVCLLIQKLVQNGVKFIHQAASRIERIDQHWHITAGVHHLVTHHVVSAMPAHQLQAVLLKPAEWLRQALMHFEYQSNDTFLHTDVALAPVRKRLWSSWNFMSRGHTLSEQNACVTYHMNQLQQLGTSQPIFVTLNPIRPIDEGAILWRGRYEHPVYRRATFQAQREIRQHHGHDGLWLCGSYMGFGFHEDAIRTAVDVATALNAPPPFSAVIQS